jgi:predicted  nucleic acid-binding Zn-ribbon protein
VNEDERDHWIRTIEKCIEACKEHKNDKGEKAGDASVDSKEMLRKELNRTKSTLEDMHKKYAAKEEEVFKLNDKVLKYENQILSRFIIH